MIKKSITTKPVVYVNSSPGLAGTHFLEFYIY